MNIEEYLNSIVDENGEVLETSEVIRVLNELKSKIHAIKKISVESPTVKGKGGAMGTVSTGKKNVGGVIVSEKDKKLMENIGGDYAKIDEVLEKIEAAIKVITQLSKHNNNSPEEVKKIILKIISQNKKELIENCEESSKDLPEKATVIKNEKWKVFGYRIATLGLAMSLLITGLGSLRQEPFEVSIKDPNPYVSDIGNSLDIAEQESYFNIDKGYLSKESAGSEAEVVGNKEALEELDMGSGVEPEVAARKEKLSDIEKLEAYKSSIEDINSNYKNIKNPTNSQWIDYQMQLNFKYLEILQFNIGIEEKTNEYLELWNELNNEHIKNGVMSNNTIEEHNKENELNNAEIEENKEQIDEKNEDIKNVERKISLYEQLKELPNIENVKNIEDVSEAIIRFMQTDIAKEIGEEELMEFMKTSDLNLFSAYTKLNIDDSKEFFSLYKLMENTYKEYVKEYCNGDNNQVQEDQYAQYFEKAIGFTDKIGETGLIDTTKAMLEQNNINNNFYEEYGYEKVDEEKDTGFWSNIKASIKTMFNGRRRGEYSDTMEVIEELQGQDKDNQKTEGR